MDLDAPHISPNGEVISKRELIAEIENLLNSIGDEAKAKNKANAGEKANAKTNAKDSKDTHENVLYQTTLSVDIMATLGFDELLSLRDGLLQKDCLQENKDWLLNLTQKP